MSEIKKTSGANSPIQSGIFNINIIGRKKIDEIYDKIVEFKKDLPKFFNDNKEDLKNIIVQILQNSFLEIRNDISTKINESTSVITEVVEHNYQKCHYDFESWYNKNKSEFEKVFKKFEEFKDNQDKLSKFIENENLKLQTQMAKSFIVLNSMQQTLIDVQNGVKLIHTGNEQIKDISKLTFNQLQYQSELMRHLNSSAERKEVYLKQILEEVLQMKENQGEFKQIVAEQKENEKIIENYRLDFQNQIKKMLNAIKEKLFSFSADINNLVNVENTADILMQQETEKFELGLRSNKRVDVMLYDIKNDIKLLSNNISSLSTEHKEMFVLLKELVEKVSNGRHGEDCEKCGSEKSRIYQCKICGYKDADGVWKNQKHEKANRRNDTDVYDDKQVYYWQNLSAKSSQFLNGNELFVIRADDTSIVNLGIKKDIVYGNDSRNIQKFECVTRLLIRNNVKKILLNDYSDRNIKAIFPNLRKISFEIPENGQRIYVLDKNFFNGCMQDLEFFGLQFIKDGGEASFSGIPNDKREEFLNKNNMNIDLLYKNIWGDDKL